jgi:hypothetical protein
MSVIYIKRATISGPNVKPEPTEYEKAQVTFVGGHTERSWEYF